MVWPDNHQTTRTEGFQLWKVAAGHIAEIVEHLVADVLRNWAAIATTACQIPTTLGGLEVRQKLITLDPTSWDFAQRMSGNFSAWVRRQCHSAQSNSGNARVDDLTNRQFIAMTHARIIHFLTDEGMDAKEVWTHPVVEGLSEILKRMTE